MARVWECPKGNDRWFQLATREDEELTNMTRTHKPRFGWKKEATG